MSKGTQTTIEDQKVNVSAKEATVENETVVNEDLSLNIEELDAEEVAQEAAQEVVETEDYALNSVSSSTGEVRETGITARPFKMEVSEYKSAQAKLARLSKMERLINLCGEYWDADRVGDSIRGLYYDIVTMTKGDDTSFQAVQILTEDKTLKSVGNVVVVSEIKRFNMERGQPLEIVFKGKGKDGRTKLFEIHLLGDVEGED